jgi:hypothetical protein
LETAVQNADWVGYTPVIEEVYNVLVDDYGYDYDHYYPQPIGTTREVFLYLGEEHAQELNMILNTVRTE